MSKPLILVTNDDGYQAPGIRFLIDVMTELGDVLVVAPESPQSGMGHAITIRVPLTLRQINKNNRFTEYITNGTPVDAVKLATHKLMDRKPDLLVSGINHGSNSSVNIIYSGTMAAVIEGAMNRIPSIGFSILDYSHDADFSPTRKYLKTIAENVLRNGLPDGTCLNVNFPVAKEKDIKGIKVCRQANAYWKEEFDARTDPHNREYFWLTGSFHNLDKGNDTDEFALENKYVSVVPVKFDLTAHELISEIKKWNFDV
jgi:5'-nucleotidase